MLLLLSTHYSLLTYILNICDYEPINGYNIYQASALSRLQIRVDGGPGGCGREARRKVYGIYIDDERQSSRPPGPRPAGLAANAPSAASPRFKGSTDPVFTAASCIWSVCRQSTLICRRDRALGVAPSAGSHMSSSTGILPVNGYEKSIWKVF